MDFGDDNLLYEGDICIYTGRGDGFFEHGDIVELLDQETDDTWLARKALDDDEGALVNCHTLEEIDYVPNNVSPWSRFPSAHCKGDICMYVGNRSKTLHKGDIVEVVDSCLVPEKGTSEKRYFVIYQDVQDQITVYGKNLEVLGHVDEAFSPVHWETVQISNQSPQSPKFKVGDRVQSSKSTKLGTVKGRTTDFDMSQRPRPPIHYYSVLWDDGVFDSNLEERLSYHFTDNVVPQIDSFHTGFETSPGKGPKFKVGDRVGYGRSCTGIVSSVHPRNDHVLYGLKFDSERDQKLIGQHLFLEQDLFLLDPAYARQDRAALLRKEGNSDGCDLDRLPYPYSEKKSELPKRVEGAVFWLNGRFVKIIEDIKGKKIDVTCYGCGTVVKSFSLEGV